MVEAESANEREAKYLADRDQPLKIMREWMKTKMIWKGHVSSTTRLMNDINHCYQALKGTQNMRASISDAQHGETAELLIPVTEWSNG